MLRSLIDMIHAPCHNRNKIAQIILRTLNIAQLYKVPGKHVRKVFYPDTCNLTIFLIEKYSKIPSFYDFKCSFKMHGVSNNPLLLHNNKNITPLTNLASQDSSKKHFK